MRGLVVIPAFNEEKVIHKVISKIPRKIHKYYIDVLVVNDGSTDLTEKNARKAKAKVISHPLNRGLGAALGTGFEYARRRNYDFLVTLDADGQHDPKEISKLLKPILEERMDFVVGSRLIKSRKPFFNKLGMPFSRKLLAFLASLSTFFLAGIWSTDSQSGFRVFSKRAINEIKIEVDRMEVSTEFFNQCRIKKLKIRELPIKSIYTKYSLKKGQQFFNSFNIIGKLALNRIIK